MVKNARIQLGAPFSESFRLPLEILRPVLAPILTSKHGSILPGTVLAPILTSKHGSILPGTALAPILTSKHGSILPGTALAPILTSLELFSGDSSLLTAYF